MSRRFPLFHRRETPNSSPRRLPTARPQLELLDDRVVPAVLQVGAGEPFATIGSAVAAAHPGDTVLVHPGTYQEAVDITVNNLTLEGVNQSAIIESPANLSGNDYAIVWVNGANNVRIQDLTVEGPYTGGFTTVDGETVGLHAGIFVSNGGSATIRNNLVTNVYDNPPSSVTDDGFGILIGSATLGTTGSAVVENNTVSSYGRVGIDVSGAGSYATVLNNTVTGLPLSLANQVGIQIGIAAESGGAAAITGNTVTQNVQTAAGTFAAGIYIVNAGNYSSASFNYVNGNSTGIAVDASNDALIGGNFVAGSTYDGIDLTDASNSVVLGNFVNNNGGDGIKLLGSTNDLISLNSVTGSGSIGIVADSASTGNTFSFNTMSNNATFDAADLSSGSGTSGTANAWIGNHGKTYLTLGGGTLFSSGWNLFCI